MSASKDALSRVIGIVSALLCEVFPRPLWSSVVDVIRKLHVYAVRRNQMIASGVQMRPRALASATAVPPQEHAHFTEDCARMIVSVESMLSLIHLAPSAAPIDGQSEAPGDLGTNAAVPRTRSSSPLIELVVAAPPSPSLCPTDHDIIAKLPSLSAKRCLIRMNPIFCLFCLGCKINDGSLLALVQGGWVLKTLEAQQISLDEPVCYFMINTSFLDGFATMSRSS